jgi:acetyl esterase/lipase
MNIPVVEKQTYTYKIAADKPILADVYTIQPLVPRPVVIWIHGGCLMYGDRNQIGQFSLERYAQAGYTVVSIDYRLAPETTIDLIIEDLQDLYAWVLREGPSLFALDGERVAVVGHSAGGYLTLMAGFCVQPRPKALVSFYGYGDIIEEWYSRPDPFYLQQPHVSEEEARRNRGLLYLWCRQTGRWPIEVSGGHDPDVEPEWFDPFCPAHNVTSEYSPTVLIHGMLDTDVPHSQSVQMAEEFEKHGVEYEFISLPQMGHGFNVKAGEPPSAEQVGVYNQVEAFLNKHL